MVKPVNSTDNVPSGYTRITICDDKTQEKKTYLVPVGKKFTMNGKTYDPSKTKNNEFVITGNKDQDKFKMAGLALEYMDANKDGRIDEKDSDVKYDMGKRINKDKRVPDGYFVDMLDPETYDAGVQEGEGWVNFSQKHIDPNKWGIGIE